MKAEATPPVNVRIRRKDGRIEPVELVYQGVDTEEGAEYHLWVSTVRYHKILPGDAVQADMIPEQTSVVVLEE